jgi:hypothetical protein
VKNIKELRDELSKVFISLKKGNIEVNAASEMNNAAGKMINTVKVQLEYSALRKEKPAIDFLEVD